MLTKTASIPTDECVRVASAEFYHDDIYSVIDDFYTRIQTDPLLKIPFAVVQNWPEHIEKLTHFWWSKFGGRPYLDYMYDPISKHFYTGFDEVYLERWLSLFHETIDRHLNEVEATLWKTISQRMGGAFILRNEEFRRIYNERITREESRKS